MKPTIFFCAGGRDRLLGASALALALAHPALAADVTLTATNTIDTTSFASALSWSNGVLPAAGNAYFVPAGFTLRTAASSTTDYIFAGDSLTLTGPNTNLVYKGSTNVNTITVNNLTLNGALVNNASNSSTAFILGGSITVAGTGTSTIFANNATITVTAPIGGNSGTLLLQTNDTLGRQVILSAANTYTGTLQATGASGAVLSSTGSLAFAIGASGVNNTITGTAPFTFDGAFNIDLTNAGDTVGDSWTLVNVGTLGEAFGGTFSIPGFTENENIWTSASGEYQFLEATGVLSRIEGDTDGDGLPDIWENDYFPFDELGQSATQDPDNDLANNLLEYQNGTDPTDPGSYPDTDGDGLNDGWELTYFNNSLARNGTLDFDNDFNSDAVEFAAGSAPDTAGSYPDTDFDDLNDGWEVHYFIDLESGIRNADPDEDLFTNYEELVAGTDPTLQVSSPDVDNGGPGDGMPDGWELQFFGDTDEIATGDFDADGYSNVTEFSLGTDPTDPDSAPGPVAWWRYEEATSGPVSAGDNGEAAFNNVVIDSSGNGNHMRTYNGQTAPAYSTDVPFATVPQGGETNTASLYFDGASDGSWLDLVFSGSGTPLRTLQFNAFTIEASFKMDAVTAGNQVVFAKDGNPLGGQPPFHLKFLGASGKFEVGLVDGAGTAKYASSIGTVSAGQWYSVAATADATTLSLWLKGPGDSAYVFQSSTPISGAFFNSYGGLDDVWAAGRGRWNGGETDIFKGFIDEVRISAGVIPSAKFLASTIFEDEDSDGMDDNWETVNFGDTDEIASGDFDGDGTSNITEYLLGLDPADGSSLFSGSLSGSTITWPAAANLSFTVQRSTSLLTNEWQNVAIVTATGTTGTWTDPFPPAGKAFYRVVLDTE